MLTTYFVKNVEQTSSITKYIYLKIASKAIAFSNTLTWCHKPTTYFEENTKQTTSVINWLFT